MNNKSDFIKSSFFYSVGIIGSKVVFFILVPIFSFFLSKQELGEYDLILVSITLITPLITLQVSDAVYRFLIQKEDKKSRKIIISTGLMVIAVGCLAFLLAVSILNRFLHYQLIFEFSLLQLTFCGFFFFQQVTRGLKTNQWYALMGVINSLLVIALSLVTLIVFEMGLKGVLFSLIISQFASIAIVMFMGGITAYITPSFVDFKIAKKLVTYSWPLLPNAISWWLIDLGNRYVILFFLSEEYNGIFAIASRYAGIVALVNSVFILTWQDFIISDKETHEDSKSKASEIFKRFFIFELSFITVLAALSKYIIQFTTDSDFHIASDYLPILLLSAGFSAFCAYFGAFYLKSKDTFGVFSTTIIGGIVNIIIGVSFINQIGLYAVAIGSLIGFITTFLLRLNAFKLVINYKVFALLLIFCFAVILLKKMDNIYVSIGSIIISIIVFIVVNKSLILKATKRTTN
ncbi:lipopolysaccharide biosynthesis protein [Winogradskyella sp.]|uniref:lipopolysaccharide biosynthesis protein n=1 Tax=Winogradskyella sp. TaxID=1883156 RepID=UPI003BA9239F